METPVAYECVAPAHQAGEGGPDKLTVHEKQWAYCPYDARAEAHQWKATGGVPLAMLKHAASMRRTQPAKARVGA